MLDTFKQLVVGQYEAGLSTLKACVDRCPDSVWNARVAKYKFCQVAFHTLFFTDYYLGADPDSFRRQPFHLNNKGIFRDYEELEDRPPVHPYKKEQILDYLAHCREKAREVMASESLETLTGSNAFRKNPYTRAELHIYNIRHIQHHSAQLILRLRLDADEDIDIPWMSGGWRELAVNPAPKA